MYEKIILDNGLRLVLRELSYIDSIGIGLWIGTGSRYEEARLGGISHFLEHLLFKGTKTRSCQDIKVSIEGVGGSLNGFTSEEFSCYLAKVPAKYAGKALDILIDMVFNPKLAPSDIDKERMVIFEEIRMYHDQPQHYVGDLLDELMWQDNSLGRPIIGTYETLKAITDIDLMNYKNTFHTPRNICICAVGKFVKDAFLKQAIHLMPISSDNQKHNFDKVQIRQKGPATKFFDKDTQQTHLVMGLIGLSRAHSQRFALSLIHIILGANMSSRLFQEVRERRALAYDIGTSIKRFKETGAFIVHAGVENNKSYKACEVIINELRKMKQRKVSDNELKRAKEFYKGQLSMSLEDSLEHMLWLGEQEMGLEKIMTKDEIFKQIDEVTADEIKDLSNIVFNAQRLNLAAIGPSKDNEIKKIDKVLTDL